MSKVFYHTDGSPSMHPTSREDAKRLRRSRYHSGAMCGVCLGTPLRFTRNGKCIHCCRMAAIDYYNRMVKTGDLLIDPQQAAAKGDTYYLSTYACKTAGHVGVLTVSGHNCKACLEAKPIEFVGPSPRQVALDAGEKWYTPLEACPKCNTTALRYVANGRCQGCKPLQRVEEGTTVTAETAMIRDYPDLVFSKQRAITNSLSVYRTGERCGYGHTTYRRVKDDACISCS